VISGLQEPRDPLEARDSQGPLEVPDLWDLRVLMDHQVNLAVAGPQDLPDNRGRTVSRGSRVCRVQSVSQALRVRSGPGDLQAPRVRLVRWEDLVLMDDRDQLDLTVSQVLRDHKVPQDQLGRLVRRVHLEILDLTDRLDQPVR